ncbi:molybdate transport system regulatory protein [Pseudarcicella hirudinis]|uniref:Molybdate transport system regulatory protein n=1 Tax=Pseudarcicella hirudinis TaxID=1079859 RepID=A0A1I5UW09_9BACT|nr:winged helix-turn-helix domain-containing protein [Pseudarcicella hirudinis]SFP99389.1 molybdate transport system regulatory protein [Pseudarcicella hirudinis]
MEKIKYKVNGRIWVEAEERFMGIGRLELLQHIDETGSISQAAKAMKMSYKRAWDLIQSMNTQSDKPLVTTQTGGEKGGGAALTEEGRLFVTKYKELHARFQLFISEETSRLFD